MKPLIIIHFMNLVIVNIQGQYLLSVDYQCYTL